MAYTPPARRGCLAAAIEFDRELSRIGDRAHEPLARQIRLAWWRDELTRLAQALVEREANGDMGAIGSLPAPSPVLKAIADAHGAGGVERDSIELLRDLVNRWEVFWTNDGLDLSALERFAEVRARALVEYAAPPSDRDMREGLLRAALPWAQADTLARLRGGALKTEFVQACQGSIANSSPPALPSWAKGFAVLGVLGRRAICRGGAGLLDGRLAALVALRAGLLGR